MRNYRRLMFGRIKTRFKEGIRENTLVWNKK